MRAVFLGVLLLLPAVGIAGTTTGDAVVTGQLGVGIAVPRARVEAQMSTADQYGLLVSSANGGTMLMLDRHGNMGIGRSPQQAKLDIQSSGDNGTTALLLRVGNSTSSQASSQIVFGLSSTETYRHSIRTRAVATQNNLNAIDFFLWNSTGQPTTLGSFNVMSLQAISTYSYSSVHVLPYGNPDVELEVSDGLSTGGGRIQAGASGTHSSRRLKTDIGYLPAQASAKALAEIEALRHASYRYKRRGAPGPVYRGLILEEAPESIHGPGGMIVVDYRVLNLELALKAVNDEIKALESQIISIENKRGGR